MRIDFSGAPLCARPFSEKPMTFCQPADVGTFAGILDLIAVETGERAAREHWQAAQLRNLVSHALQHSAVWRRRLNAKRLPGNIKLADLPILTRTELNAQVAAEGSLIKPPSPLQATTHATSGSSGTPAEFFVTSMNATYNRMRSLAQYFMDGLDISLNKVRFRTKQVDDPAGFTVKHEESWNHSQQLLRCGALKFIQCYNPDVALLCDELRRSPVGYLIIDPATLKSLLQHIPPEFFVEIGTKLLIPAASELDSAIRQRFTAVGIPIAANYSAEEVGPVANECLKAPGHYHVATSNVIVEVDMSTPADIAGVTLGRVLLTHLHSYATPFIRYEVGDLAKLSPRCPCGHDGPVLSNIYGRAKRLLLHADGRLTPFVMRVSELREIVPLKEYRLRQTELGVLTAEVVGADVLPTATLEALAALLRQHTGTDFEVRLQQVPEIDWGLGTKRLAFRNELLT